MLEIEYCPHQSHGQDIPRLPVSPYGVWGTDEHQHIEKNFPDGSDGKKPACHAADLGLIPGLGRSPGGGNGYPPQYSYLENSMDKGA